ncbi:hypothetical protein [Nostoc sp. 2RC]|uniref:hypothetical protein n=1 Tax=Nostoc sp. 2RC TaxID=2485484 RepID=UPI001624B798|nr:hypothetical protein [Nostoc sp. 2RC]MBC1238614.1 hypothetical protein [Nostoc sp. 2RC]
MVVRLENLTKGTQVQGILPNNIITIVDAQWHGSDVVELTLFTTRRDRVWLPLVLKPNYDSAIVVAWGNLGYSRRRLTNLVHSLSCIVLA